MDSPKRTLTLSPVDDLEGSPLFNFLCTLSPIKPVKSIHMSQSFSEISFPAPPSVFVSPRADHHKGFRLQQGNESKSGGEEGKSNQRCIYVTTTKRVQKFGSNTSASPSSSPSKMMEDYLAASIEGERNMGNFSSDILTCDNGEAKRPDEAESVVECTSSLRLELDKSVYTSIFSEDILFNEQNACWLKNEKYNKQKISLDNTCQRRDGDEKQPDFDEGAPQFGFLMAGEDERSQSHRFMGDWHTQDGPSSLSVEQVERDISSLKGVADEEQAKKSAEKLVKSSPMINCKENDNRAYSSVQRGARRRCLDFEVLDNHVTVKTSISASMPISQENQTDPTDPLVILRERASSAFGVTTSDSTQNLNAQIQTCSSGGISGTMVTSTTSTKMRLSNCSPSKNINQMNCLTDNSPVPISMPSGIGLHLNNVSESLPFHETNNSNGLIALNKSQEKSMQGSSKDDSRNALQQDNPKGEMVISLLEKTRMEECQAESKCPESLVSSSKSVTYLRSVTLGIKRVAELCGSDKRASLHGRKRVLLADLPHPMDSERLDECSQSPKKRRLPSADEKSGDSCKRCNCKKSKCLKLYCECFAAGVYCVGSCTCQGCLNRPEYEEIVMETRQQIESRNPLAFAPKIMMVAEPSPSNKEHCHELTAPARHKRGCNCKKSRCLKKYCECYQAGVGCSDGCRCENCENVHGKKKGAEVSEGKDVQVETEDKEHNGHIHNLDHSNECIDDGSELLTAEISPITPFEYKSQNRNITKSRSTACRRRFTPEELQSPTFSLSASMKQSRSPSNIPTSSNGAQNNSPGDPAQAYLPKVESPPISTPRVMRIGQFSPRWHGSSDICTITPLPQAPLRPIIATPISGIDGINSSPSMNEHGIVSSGSTTTSSLRNGGHLVHQVTSPLPHHHHHHSSQSLARSETPLISLRGTPLTPLFSLSNVMGENVMSCPKEPVEKEKIDQLVGLEMPELLKDCEVGRPPICLLNSSSPKHKRVSPPHNRNGFRETSSHRELQSPSSTSRRKFILRSIPSTTPMPSSAAHEQPMGLSK